MLERWITALRVEDAAFETPAETRERLKMLFPAGATRRMTQLGIALGSTLHPLAPSETDTLVYASTYAETRALESYLDSFPAPSPTLFQTSIHPGSVQQNLIQRQQPVRQFFPVTGGENLPVQALLVTLLAEGPRAILCGGEERGGWLLDHSRASDRTFAFALALSTDPVGALGHISFDSVAQHSGSPLFPLPLPVFFDHLRDRRPLDAHVFPGRRLLLRWLA
jgi:hypothetical protein